MVCVFMCLCEWRFSGVNVCVFPRKSAGLRIKRRPAVASAYLNSLSFGKFLFLQHIKYSSGSIGSATSQDHVSQTFGDCRNMWFHKNVITPFLLTNGTVHLKRLYTYVGRTLIVSRYELDVLKKKSFNYAVDSNACVLECVLSRCTIRLVRGQSRFPVISKPSFDSLVVEKPKFYSSFFMYGTDHKWSGKMLSNLQGEWFQLKDVGLL